MHSFFPTLVTVIAHTPLWVWPLYALLMFLGFQRTRDSILPLWRMLILPIVVILLAMLSLVLAGLSAVPAMLIGLAIGGVAGWTIEPAGATRRMPGGAIWLRGEWLTFVQIGLIMVFRYATNATAGLYPALNGSLTWRWSTVFIGAILSAVFLGRTAARLRVYFAARSAVV